MITHDSEYYTVREAADLLRVSVPTVWRWVRSGQLAAYRVGKRSIRIRKGDLGGMVAPSEPVNRVTSTHLVERLREEQEAMLAQRGGKPFSSSAPIIREGRRLRSKQL